MSNPPVEDTVSMFQPVPPSDRLLRMLHYWYTHDHSPEMLSSLMTSVAAYLDELPRSIQ